MKQPMKKRFESYAKNYKRRKSWQRVVSMLTCIIVFCTTYALILPAITLSGEATCGIDEHVHADACYEVIETQVLACSPVHVHTADCYEEETLICGCADFVLHTHDDNCFSESGTMLCALKKLEEHTHTEECCTVIETVTGHLHEDTCYSVELGEYACGLEERVGHTHEDACYGEQYLSCDQAESEGHAHGAECYGEAALSCGIMEDGEHGHTEACYTAELLCGENEHPGHAHGGECYSRDVICGLEECQGHAHSDECREEIRTLICELEEDGVITQEQELTCTKPEVTAHIHTDDCYETLEDEDGEEYTVLICTELEVLEHQHSAECVSVEHTAGALSCLATEHVHDETCFQEVLNALNPGVMLSGSGDDTGAEENQDSDIMLAAVSNSTSILDVDADFDAAFSNASFNGNSETYDVDLKITYSLDKIVFEAVKNGTYDAFHIALPDSMIIPDDLLNEVRYATDQTQGGMIAFDYWFEKTSDGKYVIHINYRDDYVAEMVDKGSTGTYTISFKGTVDKKAVTDNGDIVLKWSDGTETTIGKSDVDYPSDETLHYDIHTQKQGSYDIKNDTLTYTVKVYSNKGTPANKTISVTDILNLSNLSIPDGYQPTVSITDALGNSVDGATSTYALENGKPTIMITNLPALSAGGYYLITYAYEIGELASGTQHWPSNSVTATVPNPENDKPLESTTGTTVTVSKQMISKTGSFDAENGIITWTITVNAAGDNIAGYVLTDDMLQNAQSLTIVPAESGSYTLNREDGKIQSITFNAVDTNGDGTADANYNTYTITYTTAQDQSTTGGYASNNATLTPPGGGPGDSSSTGDINVWVPASGGIDKQFVDMEGNILKWSVAVTIPDGGISQGTVIKDNTGYSWDSKADNHWMTPAQIYALNEELSGKLSGIDYTLEFSADGWNWDTYSEAIADTSTIKYYCWRITFNEDVTRDELDSLTIQYSTTADTSKANTFVNTVKMGDYSDTANTDYRPAVAKLDRYYNSGITNISSTNGVIGWYIRITPEEGTDSIHVVDQLPKGVTLTKIGISSGYGSSGTAVAEGGTGVVTDWLVNANYTVTPATDTAGQQVDITITPYPGTGTSINADKDIYVYFECTIDDMPEPGESKSYTFTNQAVVDEVPVEQTQNVTVTIPATVIKMDSNGNTSDTSHSYGADDEKTVGWYVRVYLPEGAAGLSDANPIVVTDDLPAGLKLTKIGIGGTMYDARYGKDYNTNPATDLCVTVGDSTSGSLRGTDNAYLSTYTITATDGSQDVTVKITNGGNAIAANSYIYIYYECEIMEGATGSEVTEGDVTTTTYEFDNHVSVEIGGEPFGEDDHKQTIIESSVQEQEKQVDKSVNFDAGVSQLQYTVLLNEKGEDLHRTEETIQVIDVMTHNVDRWWNTKHSTLISSSVKLYYPLRDTAGNILYDADGNALPGAEVPADAWSWIFYDNYEDVLNYKTDQIVNTIEAWIPDGVALVLKYIYAFDIDAEWDTGFQVSNKVTLYGETVTNDEVTSNETWEYSEVTATATSSGTYTIHKVKQGNYNIVLPNAEFTVYTNSDDQPVLDANGNVVVYKSDNDGLVKISKADYFQEDVVYYAMETKAPDGYFLPDNPDKIYFYFGGDNAGSLNLPSGAVDLNYTFGVAYIQNEEDDMSITVGKSWPDGAPDNFTEVQFQLIQTDISGNEVVWFVAPEGATEAQIEGKYYTIVKLADDTWQSVTIDHLQEEDLDGNPYTYTVKELNVPDNYISEISTDANGNITITNSQMDATSISVQKAWHGANMAKNPVQVQLYQSIDTLFTEYTAYLGFIDGDESVVLGQNSIFTVTTSIIGAGDYTLRWDMSLFGFEDTDDVHAFYIDVVDPLFALEGYTIENLFITTDKGSYNVNGNFKNYFSEHGGGYKRVNFYNIYDDALYMDVVPQISANGYLEVRFTLVPPANDANNGKLPELNEFVSVANTGGVAYGNPVTLDASNNWAAGWSNLPLTGVDSEGNLVYYSYYVKEITDGYDVRYSNDYAVNDGTIIVTNYPKSTAELTVNKQWLDENGNDIPPPENSVTYDLYQEELYVLKIYKGGWGWANEDIVYVKPGTTITLTFIGAEIVESTNYQQLEREFIGCITEHGGNVALYKYKLTRTITDEITSIGMSYGGYALEVNDKGEWVKSAGYDIGTYDLYDWNGNNVGKYTLGSYELLTPIPDGYTPQFEYVDTYTLSESNNWSNVHEDLPPAWYKVVETTTGYETTYIVGDGEESSAAPEFELDAGESETVTINNRLSTTSISVEKAWLDDEQTRYKYDMLTFTLYQDGVEYSTGVLYMEKDANGNYSWKTTIEDLPKSHPQLDDNGDVVRDGNGNIVYVDYVYTVKETPIDGFNAEYSANGGQATSDYSQAGVRGGGTITIINEQRTSIGVKKYWADGVSPTAVRLELWKYSSTTGPVEFQVPMVNGQVDYEALKNTPGASYVRYATICDSSGAENSTTSSSKTFKNLQLYEFNGDTITTYYTYFIVEVADGYVKTYTEDNFITGGSYTITNDVETTSIAVNKQWTDGSDTPVDVSLYQVFTPVSTHTCSYTLVVTAPTCTAYGYTTYTCSVCGHTYVDNYTDPVSHNWNNGEEIKKPTENETGIMRYTCYTCGTTRDETIAIIPHVHNYSSVVTKEPTCTEMGVRTYTCTCGNSYTESISPNGHSMGEWSVQTPATCVQTGTQIRTCSVCGTKETVTIPVVDHDWGEGVITKDPTETETGIKTYTCNVCGETKTEDIPATGSGSSEIVLWSGTIDASGWYNEPITMITDASIFAEGGHLSVYVAASPSDNVNSGIGVTVNNVEVKRVEPIDGRGGNVVEISYADIISKIGTADVTSIGCWAYGLSITKITWTPGTSANSLNSINYTNRVLYSDGNSSNSLGGTYIGTKQVVPGTTTTWTELPKYKLDDYGNIIGEYTYYVVEVGGAEYDATYAYGSVTGESQMSSGISSGTITITNRQEYHYELPSTGGSGTFQYTLGGIFLLMAGGVVLMYNHKKGRREARSP